MNYHERTAWHELLYPMGTPEFALLDSSKELLYRWFGEVTPDEFAEVFDPLCT